MAAGQNLLGALGALYGGANPLANYDLFLHPERFREQIVHEAVAEAKNRGMDPKKTTDFVARREAYQMDQWRRSANMVISQTVGSAVGGPLGRIVGAASAFAVGQAGAGKEGEIASTLAMVSKFGMFANAAGLAAEAVQKVVQTLGKVAERADELAKYNGRLAYQKAIENVRDIRSDMRSAKEHQNEFAMAQESYALLNRQLRELIDRGMAHAVPALVMLVDIMSGVLMMANEFMKVVKVLNKYMNPVAKLAELWAKVKPKEDPPAVDMMKIIRNAKL